MNLYCWYEPSYCWYELNYCWYGPACCWHAGQSTACCWHIGQSTACCWHTNQSTACCWHPVIWLCVAAIFQHYMISSKTDLVNDEGWPWLEQNPKLLNLDICAEGKALNPTNFPDIDVDEHPYPPILHYCNAYEPEYYDKHYVWSKYQINLGIAQKDGGAIGSKRTFDTCLIE